MSRKSNARLGVTLFGSLLLLGMAGEAIALLPAFRSPLPDLYRQSNQLNRLYPVSRYSFRQSIPLLAIGKGEYAPKGMTL